MEQHWLIIERLENWEADQENGFSFFGLPRRYKGVSSNINKGDKVYCYVSSGIGAFTGIRVVSDTGIKEMKQDRSMTHTARAFRLLLYHSACGSPSSR